MKWATATQGNKMTKARGSGFTLIELMVTVTVVGILLAIAIPSYRQYVIRGKRNAAQSTMMDLSVREQQMLMANRAYATTATLTANGYLLDSDVSQNYTWAVTVNNAATPPTFSIIFTPIAGQASDGALTLNSRGDRTPLAKWQ